MARDAILFGTISAYPLVMKASALKIVVETYSWLDSS